MLGFSHQSLANFLFWVTQKKWFLVALFIGLVLLLLPTPHDLSLAGYRSIIIVVTALIMIIKEPIPLPAIALYILVLEVYFGIDSPDGIAHSFMNVRRFFYYGLPHAGSGNCETGVGYTNCPWDNSTHRK